MAEIVILDFETTGIAPRRDRVIEVGAAAVDILSGEVVRTFSKLCLPKPDCKVSKTVSRLTGITTEMLLGQPSTAVVISELLEFIGDCPVLAHNVTCVQ